MDSKLSTVKLPKLEVVPVSNFLDYEEALLALVQMNPRTFGSAVASSIVNRTETLPSSPPPLSFVPKPRAPPGAVAGTDAYSVYELDLERHEFERAQAKSQHDMALKADYELKTSYKQGSTALFGLIKSSLSPAAEARVTGDGKYGPCFDAQDGIELFVLVEALCGPSSSAHKPADITAEMNRLRLVRQKPRESAEDHAQKFRKQLKVLLSVLPDFTSFEQVRTFFESTDTRFHAAISQLVSFGRGYPASFEEAAAFLIEWEKSSAGLTGLFKPVKGADIAHVAKGDKPKYGPCELCKSKGLPFGHSPQLPHCPSLKDSDKPGAPKSSIKKGKKDKKAAGRKNQASTATSSIPDIVMSGIVASTFVTESVNFTSDIDDDESDDYPELEFSDDGSVNFTSDIDDDESDDCPELESSDDGSEFSDDENEVNIGIMDEDTGIDLVLDSGANVSIVSSASLLQNIRTVNGRSLTGISGPATTYATHSGFLQPFDPDALVADVNKNVLSVHRALCHGFKIRYDEVQKSFILHRTQRGRKEEHVFRLNDEGLYVMRYGGGRAGRVNEAVGKYDNVPNFTPIERKRAAAALRLHAAMGHPCDAYLGRALDSNAYRGTSLTSKDLRNARAIHGPCPGCALGKITEAPSPEATSPPAAPYSMLHIDFFFVRGAGGKKQPYLISVEESTGHLVTVKCASRKLHDVVEAVLSVRNIYKGHGHVIKKVRSDREAAFIAMEPFLNASGIIVDRTSSGRHAKMAERQIRCIKDHVRAVRSSLPFRLPLDLVQHLVADVVISLNNTVNSKTGGRTPRDLLTGDKLNLERHYRLAFGDIAIFQKRSGVSNDEGPRGGYGMVIGRDLNSQGSMRVYFIGSGHTGMSDRFTHTELTKDLIASIDKIADMDPLFSEEDLITLEFETEVSPTMEGLLRNSGDAAADVDEEEAAGYVEPESLLELPSAPAVPIVPIVPNDIVPVVPANLAPADVPLNPTGVRRVHFEDQNPLPGGGGGGGDVVPVPVVEGRARRAIKPVKRLDPNPYLRSYDDVANSVESVAWHVTVSEIEARRGAEVVKHSVLEELKSIFDTMQALSPVLRASTKPLPLHMLHKEKMDSDGAFIKVKSRLVAGGNLQPRTEDLETTSSTVRIQSVFLLLNIAASMRLSIAAIDIKSAYLHAQIRSKDIYGRLSKKYINYLLVLHPEWSQYLQGDGSILFRIDKALYGLAEAARLWFLHLTALLKKHGYIQSTADRAVLLRTDGVNRVYICLHVDDMLVLYTVKRMYDDLLAVLQSNLAGVTKQEGASISFLGTSITIANGAVSVCRPGYIDSLVAKYNIESAAATPCSATLFDVATTGDILPTYELHSQIMAVRYLDDVRPDIKFVTSVLTTLMSKPTAGLKSSTDRVLAYLHGTRSKVLTFKPANLQIFAYVDASYCVHGTVSWYCVWISLGEFNAPFHLKCGRIRVVCRSSTEAELYALNESISDIIHYVELMAFLDHKQNTVVIYEDNTATIALMSDKDVNYSARSKHVQVKVDFFREQVAAGKVVLKYIQSEHQRADFGTKPFVGKSFGRMVKLVLNE